MHRLPGGNHRVHELVLFNHEVHHHRPRRLHCFLDRAGHVFLLGHPDTPDAVGFRQLHEVGVAAVDGGEEVLVVEEVLPLPHHAQRPVVQDGVLHVDLVLNGRGQVAQRHLEPAVAGDGPHRLLRPAHLGSQRRRHFEPHGSAAARRDQRVRLLVAVVLRRPHLVLPDAGHDDGFSVGLVRNLLHHLLRQQHVRLADEQRGMLRPQCVSFLDPVQVHVGLHHRYQRAQAVLQVAQHRRVGHDVLVELRGVHVNVNDLGAGREVAEPPGNPVVEPRPQRYHQVRSVDGQARVGHPVHPRHSHVQHMLGGHRADAQQRGDHRDLRFLRQFPQLVPRPRDQDAVPGQDHRPLRLVDQVGGDPHLARIRLTRRVVAGQVHLGRPLELNLLAGQYVLRHVDQYRAGPPGARDVKGFLNGRRDVPHVHHQVVVFGYRQRDARDVGLLEGVAADRRPRHLPGDAHDGHRVHLRRHQSGHQVRCPRPRGGGAYPHLARGPGVAVRGHRGGLLVPYQDVAQLGITGQRAVERQYRAAGQPEYRVHALAQQAFANDLRACHFHISATPVVSPGSGSVGA